MLRGLLLLFLLLVLLPGCATHQPLSIDQYREGLLRSKQLVATYGQFENSFVRGYFDNLVERMQSALRRQNEVTVDYKVILLATSHPMALSAGGGFVLFSKGLVLSLGSEAELAFILAHEIAHQRLGHLDNLIDKEDQRPDLELAADRYAVPLMALAGYDPRMALSALHNAYNVGASWGHSGNYPDLDKRVEAVKSQIIRSHWQPPGTVNRRDFVALQRLLAQP